MSGVALPPLGVWLIVPILLKSPLPKRLFVNKLEVDDADAT